MLLPSCRCPRAGFFGDVNGVRDVFSDIFNVDGVGDIFNVDGVSDIVNVDDVSVVFDVNSVSVVFSVSDGCEGRAYGLAARLAAADLLTGGTANPITSIT